MTQDCPAAYSLKVLLNCCQRYIDFCGAFFANANLHERCQFRSPELPNLIRPRRSFAFVLWRTVHHAPLTQNIPSTVSTLPAAVSQTTSPEIPQGCKPARLFASFEILPSRPGSADTDESLRVRNMIASFARGALNSLPAVMGHCFPPALFSLVLHLDKI
jgi:hypothetical protein